MSNTDNPSGTAAETAAVNAQNPAANEIERGAARELDTPSTENPQGIDEAFVRDLDARMAKADLDDRGWRDRDDIGDVMRDMRRLAGADWQKADKLWEKHRGTDSDKPVFLDKDYVDPAKEAEAKGPAQEEERDRQTSAKAREREEERKRLERAAELLRRRYLVADNKYYERDEESTLAFEDKGTRLATKHNDPETARNMIELAEAKGWEAIKVKGNENFKAEVWVQAAARGMDVRGYKPRDVDLARLEELKAARAFGEEERANTVERTQTRTRNRQTAQTQDRSNTQDAASSLSRQQETAVEALKSVLRNRGESEKAVNMAAEVAAERFQNGRVYVGRVMEHGQAPYEHNKDNKGSYYVKLDTEDGERTVWGVDLQRAISEGGINRGDEVMLANRGRQQVTVTIKDRDEDGKVKGTREITTHRNTWEAQNIEHMRAEVLERMEKRSRDKGRQPVLKVYDNEAARSIQRPAPERAPERGKDTERTR